MAGDDPVWQAYREDRFTDAADLCQHAELRYGTVVQVAYTLRPWSEKPEDEIMVTGHPGAVWQVAFYPRAREFDIRKFWAELTYEARKLLLHVTISTGGALRVTFPAVESPESLSHAIGDAITASMRSYAISAESIRPPEHMPPMDSRVLLNTALAWVCSDLHADHPVLRLSPERSSLWSTAGTALGSRSTRTRAITKCQLSSLPSYQWVRR